MPLSDVDDMGHATSFFSDAWRASSDVKARHFLFCAEWWGRGVRWRGREEGRMTRFKNVSDIVKEADRILFHDLDCLQDKDAEFYFRGESLKFARKNEGTALPLGTSFPCFLDREEAWWKNERELYQEALRLNVVSFEEDKTMVERLARMQHYQMPTRFCDMTSNVFRQEGFA